MSILQEATSAAAGQSDPKRAPEIDLATCAPEELASWLLSNRFEDNAVDVASFLLQCTSTLPNAEEISAQLMGGGDDDDEEMAEAEDSAESSGEAAAAAVAEEAVAEPPSADPQTALLRRIQHSQPQPAFANQSNNEIEVSCTNPRGKFALSLYKGGLVLTNPKKPDEEQIPIAPDSVKNAVWFRKPEDYKKLKQQGNNGGKKKGIPGHMVLICLTEEGEDEGVGIKFRNKALGSICFQLPSYPVPTDDGNAEGDGTKELTEEDWWNGMSTTLFSGGKGGIVRVHASMDSPEYAKGKGGFVFRSEGESGSTTTTEGMPFVGCYQGFNDGALFPLREGLLFFKPPLFVPRSKLASISCGRGSGGSRYVDMTVQLDVPGADEQEGTKKKQSDALEWTNIHRDELNGLNDYIHKTLIPAMQADASEDSDDDEEVAVAEVVKTDEDESAFGSDGEEEDEESGRKRRSSRAASKSAREITRAALNAGAEGDDDSDDDSDAFEVEDAATDGSDDESVLSDQEGSDASSDDEEEEHEDESDEDDSRKSKKARVD